MTYATNYETIITTVKFDCSATATLGPVLIGNTPPGYRFCPLIISVECLDVVGGTTGPEISIGTDSGGTPAYSNWLNDTPLPFLTQYQSLLTGAGGTLPAPSADPGTTVNVNLIAASDATTYTMRISVTGILYNTHIAPPPP
ncbi:MAG TPA: hypothetical protein VGF75_00960 [Candidatus Saccharimonadales bacterium]|jgi:hypothetical protein